MVMYVNTARDDRSFFLQCKFRSLVGNAMSIVMAMPYGIAMSINGL